MPNLNPRHFTPTIEAQLLDSPTASHRIKLESAAHFVQALDHLQHHQSSSLFEAAANSRDFPYENSLAIHQGDGNNNDQFGDSPEDHTSQPSDSYEEPSDDEQRNAHRKETGDEEPEHHSSGNRDRPTTWLVLDKDSIRSVCHENRGADRINYLGSVFLSHCSRYNMANLSSRTIFDLIAHNDSLICEQTLGEFLQLDETIAQFDRLFTKLLMRYNCHNGYSVKWNCDDCKTAYKDWLCATHLPFYMKVVRIKPCISFCERVEQRCPYLHPITREQYGGQPVFICRDPNIPFVPEITPDIPYSDPGNCYDLCHLSDNLTELVIDSLSKYDYLKCPNESAIAGSVQSGCRDDDCEPPPTTTTTTSSSNGEPDLAHDHAGTDDGEQPTSRPAPIQPHKKKLDELREVLANYKNQAKTHSYHAEHSSIDPHHHSKSPGGDTSHSSR